MYRVWSIFENKKLSLLNSKINTVAEFFCFKFYEKEREHVARQPEFLFEFPALTLEMATFKITVI